MGKGARQRQHLIVMTRKPSLGNPVAVSFHALGKGEWDGCDALWLNTTRLDITSSAFHFHPGSDGVLGAGLVPISTGGDQGVDAFWDDLPALAMQPFTFSRIAYWAIKTGFTPLGTDGNVLLVGDYRLRKCRQFDNVGTQTAFAWTLTPTWQILDAIIEFALKREQTSGEALSAAEKTRIDFAEAATHATDCDTNIGAGIKRFENSLVVPGKTNLGDILSRMLVMCRSYIVETDGKIAVRMDKARASTFTLTVDHLARSVEETKSNVRSRPNRLIGKFFNTDVAKIADIDTVPNSGLVRAANVVTVKCKSEHAARVGEYRIIQNATDASFNGEFKVTVVTSDLIFKYAQVGAGTTSGNGQVATAESRFMAATKTVDHEEHQFMAGQRGIGLTVMPRVISAEIDLGSNTYERAERILKGMLVRDLGVGLLNGDLAGAAYKVPVELRVQAWAHSVDATGRALLAQIPGDVITIDKSSSEEWQGDYEVLEMSLPRLAGDEYVIELLLKEYIASAFSDVAGPQPVLAAVVSAPVTPITQIDAANNNELVIGRHAYVETRIVKAADLLDNIRDTGRYKTLQYHDSAARVQANTDRFGNTSALAYATVASFIVHLPPDATQYSGTLAANNADSATTIAGPSVGTNVVGGGGTAWTNPGNITAQDGTNATCALAAGANSQDLRGTGFGFAIPSYHTILGVTARVRRQPGAAGSINDLTVKLLKAGVLSGNNKALVPAWAAGVVDATYGGAADLWGNVLAPADVNNANFGLSFEVVNNAGVLVNALTDYMELTITTDQGNFSGKARLKIGAQLSNEIILTAPAVAASGTASVTGLVGNTDVTVEVQAIVTSAAGNVEGRFTQKQYTDQDTSHFA
jgi:hypothetical protein